MYYYAVHKGNTTGIYTSWADAEQAIKGYSGAVHRRFNDIATAEHFVKTGTIKTKSLFGNNSTEIKTAPASVSASASTSASASASVSTSASASEAPKDIFDKYYQHRDYKFESNTIHVYCDGSTIGNGKADATGGYGVFIPKNIHVPEKRISEKVKGRTTNNIAELKALNRALEQIILLDMDLDEQLEVEWVIHYDSQYAVNVVTGTNNAKANIELVNIGKSLLNDCKFIKLSFHHVYSHTGADDLHSIGNSIADQLASSYN